MAATFADYFTIKLGEVTVKGRRLTVREIRERYADFVGNSLDVEKCRELIVQHVTLEDGKAFDPDDLSPVQMRKLVGELVLPEEGRGISDFIGLLSPTGA